MSVGRSKLESVRAGDAQAAGSDIEIEIGDRPAADDGETAAKLSRQSLEKRPKGAGNADRVRSLGKLDQSPVEIEEQGRAVEQGQWRKTVRIGHGSTRGGPSRESQPASGDP